MIDGVEATGNVSLDKPFGSRPCLPNVRERGVTATVGTKPMGMVAKARLIICLKDEAYPFLQQFIRPRWHAQGALLSILFRNVDTSDWRPSIAFMTEVVYDRCDFPCGHAIHCFAGCSLSHCSFVGVQTSIGSQIQVRVIQLSIDVFQRQLLSATFLNDP